MRRALLALLRARGLPKLSFKTGRQGWLITSREDLALLRSRGGRWIARVTPVHVESGRFLVRPSSVYFIRSLAEELTLTESAKQFFFTPQRRERLRRLEIMLAIRGRAPSARVRSSNNRAEHFFHLALRLDSLGVSKTPDALWKYVARDFDRLWSDVPLFVVALGPLELQILDRFCALNNQIEG